MTLSLEALRSTLDSLDVGVENMVPKHELKLEGQRHREQTFFLALQND